MFNNAKLKIKAVGEKLLSLVSGGAGLIEEVRIRKREKDHQKRKEAEKHKARKY